MKCVLILTLCLLALISCGKDKSTEPVGLSAVPPPPEESLLWQYRTGNEGELVIVSPTVADGVVFAGSHNDHVYALDAETGELLWSFETASDLDPPPTVADGVVFVQDLVQDFALDASTGELLWSDEGSVSGVSGRTGYRFTDTNDSIRVSAIDVASGDQIWATEVPRLTPGFPLLFPLTHTGKNIYVSDDHEVHALDASTGELVWSFRTESPVQTPPTGAAGKVYMISGYTSHALDEATGEPLWSYEPVVTGTRAYLSPPVVVDGIYYLPADELHALDAATGQRLWSSDVRYPSEESVVSDGMVLVTDIFGALYALDAATGASVWSLAEEDWDLTAVQVVDGILYAHSLTGFVHTFDARTGEPIWSLRIGYHWWRRPFAVSGGVMYVGYQLADSGVYAFTAPGNR